MSHMPSHAVTVARYVLAMALASVVMALGLPGSGRADEPAGYLVGLGIADITGEAAETATVGYSTLDARTTGIHIRQRSRAFVIVDQASHARVAFVQADIGLMFDSVHQAVLERLSQFYGSTYTANNVVLTANHTHAGPGGYSHYTLYNFNTLGFHGKTFTAIVDGIVDSIRRAHEDLAPGTLSLGIGELTNASVNRSRRAFERNPDVDKAHFPDAIDPQTTVLRLDRGGVPVGEINWFATHGTSMTNKNTLISGDNKGYAALHWEREVEGDDYLDEQPDFVAAFAQTNAGDMSPNLNLRPGSGPTEDEFENTRIIGLRQYSAARAVFDGPQQAVTGSVESRYSTVDMGATTVAPAYTTDGQTHETCHGAFGASFAAGSTEDGPGPGIASEGAGSNPLFGLISEALYTASPELRDCQSPKEIFLPSGDLGLTPEVLPVQLVKIGQLYLIAVPQEFTIVSGLRIRQTVAEIVGAPLQNVLVSGYANSYAGYVTTPEEYEQGDYEAGHTLFGKWTLPAYQQHFARLATDLVTGQPSDPGPGTPDNSAQEAVALQPAAPPDTAPLGGHYGDVLTQPAAGYARGEQAAATFASAYPNNNLRRGGTYLEVQRWTGSTWRRVYDDGDWSTKFNWARDGLTGSTVTVTWDIPAYAAPGTYRLVHHGEANDLVTGRTPFTGVSRKFVVK